EAELVRQQKTQDWLVDPKDKAAGGILFHRPKPFTRHHKGEEGGEQTSSNSRSPKRHGQGLVEPRLPQKNCRGHACNPGNYSDDRSPPSRPASTMQKQPAQCRNQ